MSHFRYRVSKLASIFVMAGLLALGSAVAEAKTVIRIAFETNLNVLPGLAFVVFKNLVESKSNGTMEVQLFPSMQLGTNLEMIEGVKAGTHEMGTSTLAWFSSFYPKIEMFEMPFLIGDWATAKRLVNSDIAKKMTTDAEKKSGIKIGGWFGAGYRYFFNKKGPVKTLADVKGLKIRLQKSPLSIATWEALGANPISLSYNELYQALQTGVVSGAEVSITGIADRKFYEVAKYITETKHVFNLYLVYVNPKFYAGLPAGERKIFDDSLEAAVASAWVHYPNYARIALEQISAKGGEINKVSASVFRSFQEAAQPVYDKFGGKYGEDFKEVLKIAKGK